MKFEIDLGLLSNEAAWEATFSILSRLTLALIIAPLGMLAFLFLVIATVGSACSGHFKWTLLYGSLLLVILIPAIYFQQLLNLGVI